MSEADAVRLGDEPEQPAIAVETPRLSLLGYVKAAFISTVQDFIAHQARRVLVRWLQRVVAVPLDADDGDECLGKNASDGDVGLEVFEFHNTRAPF